MLEIINSIISLTIISVLFMYANYTAKTKEYKKLIIVTNKVSGDFKYNLNVSTRKFWTTLYRLEDKYTKNHNINIRYF